MKASASGIGVHEGLPSGAGLGRREARRRGLGTAQVPNDRKTAEPLPVQPCESLRAVNPHPCSMTVMAGCGSSMSSGPQTAVNLTSRGARLSLRTYSATGKRSQPGRLRRMANGAL